jgi:hypothetical protein
MKEKLSRSKRNIRKGRDNNEKGATAGWASSRIVHIIFGP